MTTISALPPAPSRDDPANFNTRAEAFNAALSTFRTEANTVAGEVNSAAAAAAASQSGAATQAGNAANSATTATSAAASAISAANATAWVSGTNYTAGTSVVWSPANLQTYRRKTNGAGTTDPSLDTTNWVVIAALPDQTGNAGKFLTTNGSVASWGDVDVSGKVPIGGMIPLDSQVTADVVTSPNGDTYLKTGVSAPTATYPNAAHSYNITAVTSTSSPSTLRKLCYGNGAWVGSNSSNQIYYSLDGGATWTLATGVWAQSVTFGGGKFVAVASQSSYTSTNGFTWTANSNVLPISSAWRAIGYGNGVFVTLAHAVGASANAIATSVDGVTWTGRSNPITSINMQTGSSYSANTLATNGTGSWVAVNQDGASNNYIYSTNDGATWTASSFSSFSYGMSITYGGGRFVAVGTGTQAAWSATASGTFTASTLTGSHTFPHIHYANGKFIVQSPSTSAVVCHSTDGATWGNANNASQFSCVATDGTIWLGSGGTVGAAIVGSTNGWQFSSISGTTSGSAVTYNDGKYCCSVLTNSYCGNSYMGVSYNGGKSYIAAAGLGSVLNASTAIYFNSLYIAATAAVFATTPDTMTWTTRTVTYKGGYFGAANNVLFSFSGGASTGFSYSSDGTTYTDVTGLASGQYRGAVYLGGKYIIWLYGGTQAYTATTLSTWSSATLPAACYDIFVCGGKFVAVANSGFWTSTDAVTWVQASGTAVAYATNLSDGNSVMSFSGTNALCYMPSTGLVYIRKAASNPSSTLGSTDSANIAGPAMSTISGNSFTAADVVINDTTEKTYISGTTAGQTFYRRVA